MDLVRHSLESIQGIGIFPIIGFVIFFVTFIVLLIHTIKMTKEETEAMKQIPFDDNEENNMK